MEPGLRTLLDRNGVDPQIADYLEAKTCLKVETFANWVKDREEVTTKILMKTDHKDDEPQAARLKMAWRQAEAATDRALKRSAEGLDNEPIDDPLPEGDQRALEDVWRRAYGWPALIGERMGCDSLLGRAHREFRKCAPTMFPVSKVRTIATSRMAVPPTKRRISEGLYVTIDGDTAIEGEEDLSGSLFVYLDLLEVLTNTWSIAGAFDYEHKGVVAKYASWPQTSSYYYFVKKEVTPLLATFTEASVVTYASSCEEVFRMKCIDLARGADKVPFGKALDEVQILHKGEWLIKKGMLAPKRSGLAPTQRPPSSHVPEPPRQRPADKAADKSPYLTSNNDRNNSNPKKWTTAYKDASGNRICKFYNDKRGCKGGDKCLHGNAHVCDVLLTNGRVCASKSHTRVTHSPKSHGEPKIKGK